MKYSAKSPYPGAEFFLYTGLGVIAVLCLVSLLFVGFSYFKEGESMPLSSPNRQISNDADVRN